MTIKAVYEDWFRKTQPKDMSATQIIEVRRAFYCGYVGALTNLPATKQGLADLMNESCAFFDAEVQSGHGVNP